MLNRFQGDSGHRLKKDLLNLQRMVQGNSLISTEVAEKSTIREFSSGETLIEQNGHDNSIYFILSGSVEIFVNGYPVALRGAGNHVGEMAAIEPAHRRSATVIAKEDTIVAELSEHDFTDIATRYPEIYRLIARELSRRLLERNKLVSGAREKIKVFLICSTEALPIARAVQTAFEHDNFLTTLWTDGVFKISHYPLQSLEEQVDSSDFAIAVAHADDLTIFRGQEWPSSRDNVVFELGLFMGRLGRQRAILMEPRESKIKLPSDLAGITTITYRFEEGSDAAALIAPACNQLRNHIVALGPNN
ncbi:cAMP-activated global transcriptional regulator CRP [Komagataeibacter europaeus]|uniref:Cyclic nucleotide-binding protein n=3 Tax=Acetobacteraceae TaxID=433 RepID=A0A149QSY4_9PROT|nr:MULTISPECIES: TIR domain-containing protein [Acetobacteraceae]KON62846.1 cAMP-activated global transcriptional regulator CRP [Komagataeibacter europaeus]KXV00400.1 cyclic nucleotide-binding protein [Acetobacter cerevisiae]MCP1244167.1 nucleotide-binding protein [Acetobacter lambici]MCP1259934.1 nucleotide-binding protein [Acetobacter lambici]NHO58324.1 cyclic nucleotide-binding domain-containing protein [Acetobacter lambici]